MQFPELLLDKSLCKVRTITTFLKFDFDQRKWPSLIEQANKFCVSLADDFKSQGYQVQSIRIVTNAFSEYIDTTNLTSAQNDLRKLNTILTHYQGIGLRLRFAIGEAKNAHELSLIPELIKEFGDLCNVCVNIPADQHFLLDKKLIDEAVKTVRKISDVTPRGEGNFNFTVNFNCQPLIPYFPASYVDSAHTNTFVIGLETPDLLVATLKAFNSLNSTLERQTLYEGYHQALVQQIQQHVDQLQKIIDDIEEIPYRFAGLDSSAAPSKNCASMTEVYELMGVEYFGAAGTVEASSLLTRVFKSIKTMPLVGFSGLMLALTEDRGLAVGSHAANFDIRALLTYSAVCGIGLDTVPIPGNTPSHKLSALMCDTGTMAFRLNKPLTVRVFPVPGLVAGDTTSFESDDLCNCTVLAVP
ncbi:DUF711 family protein [Psychromonas sp. 14N.309.X.WAT.B.A12]|uniref:DUF711 family protein n=1 Tax=Psychromonas sp. 14N.309.X.WAT.B.A12 TaxID=2998322 RepID=UPI0025AFD4F3|nr:DUF711 family protein [Psychromonas sp. 14N.309.X.WAT.B.A12]MDN2662239.1 DUF711 family protein [Psychromonas sp. 14N.309.X.WAT.B.A12]